MYNRLFIVTVKIGKETKKFPQPITFLEAALVSVKHPNCKISMKAVVI